MIRVRPRERALLAAAGMIVLIGVAAPAMSPDSVATAVFYDMASLAAAAVALLGTLRLPVKRRRAWWLITAGCGCFFVGDVVWDVYEHLLHIAPPLPSVADVAYIAAYPLLGSGVLALIRQRTTVDPVNALLDAGTLGMALSLVVWESLLLDAGESVVGALVAGAYPVGDLALIGLIGIFVGSRRPTPASSVLLGGAVVLLVADLTFLVLEGNGSYSTGGWPDPLFVIGAFLLALSPWLDDAESDNNEVGRRVARPVIATVVVVAALVAVPIDFGLADNDRLIPFEAPVRAGSARPAPRVRCRAAGAPSGPEPNSRGRPRPSVYAARHGDRQHR